MNTNQRLNTMVKVALLSAVAIVIYFIEFALTPVLPFFPDFLKLDFSDLAALIGAFAFGPLAGIVIELIKNLIHVTMTTTGGVGELANFIVGAALVAPAGWYYKKEQTKAGALKGIVLGAVSMAVFGALANYFILIPFYSNMMPIEELIGWISSFNSAVVDLKTYILYVIVPFNVLKALIVGIITVGIYKYISPLLKGNQ